MDRKIFVGDKVKTNIGAGIVVDARSWRECITDMRDYQAVEFSEKCRLEAGANFKKEWVELLVNINGKRTRFLGHQVEIMEGRDV